MDKIGGTHGRGNAHGWGRESNCTMMAMFEILLYGVETKRRGNPDRARNAWHNWTCSKGSQSIAGQRAPCGLDGQTKFELRIFDNGASSPFEQQLAWYNEEKLAHPLLLRPAHVILAHEKTSRFQHLHKQHQIRDRASTLIQPPSSLPTSCELEKFAVLQNVLPGQDCRSGADSARAI